MTTDIARAWWFTSQHHATWFAISFVNFAMYVLLPPPHLLQPVFGLSFHALTAATAYYMVVVRGEHSRVYSADCIWFNAVMFLAYTGMATTFTSLE